MIPARSAGDLGIIHKNRLDPCFEMEVFKLEIGSLRGIIETRFDYQVVRVKVQSVIPLVVLPSISLSF
jgi:hypothetical protein